MEKIRFEHITRIFGSVVANNDISFSIEKGEVISILGENGSGKTTLLNILDGIYQQDEGKIYIDGEEVNINSPKDAFSHGIGMVHQHFKLVDVLTATENVVLGLNKKEQQRIYDQLQLFEGKAKYDIKESKATIEKMCNRYGFHLDLNKHVFDMSVSEKQTLEIIKVLYRGVDTLVLDEPTAVLTPQEIKHLFDIIRNMKNDGKTVIIITHKLNEVLEISDSVAVLRKGEFIEKIDTKECTEALLAELMVGKQIDLDIHRSNIPNTGVRLEIRNLSANNIEGREILHDISFDVYGSEILGIAAISGSGQKELLETIAGLNKETDGTIIFHNPKKNRPVTLYHKNIKQIRELASENRFYFKDGSPCNLDKATNKQIKELVQDEKIIFYEDEIMDLKGKKPIEIRELGIKLSFVPEDRLGMGLVGNMDIVDNMMLKSYKKGKGGFFHREKPRSLAETIISELEIQTPSANTQVSKLSGGNIQKVLVGREISSQPKVLMVAYPVRGLDINSSFLIYKLLDEQKKRGSAIIFVGEDLDVLLGLCDRLLVLSNGYVTGIVDPRVTKKEEVGLLMTKGQEL